MFTIKRKQNSFFVTLFKPLINFLKWIFMGIFYFIMYAFIYLFLALKYIGIFAFRVLYYDYRFLYYIFMMIIFILKYACLGVYFSLRALIFNYISIIFIFLKKILIKFGKFIVNELKGFGQYIIKKFNSLPIIVKMKRTKTLTAKELIIDINSLDAKRSEKEIVYRYKASKNGKIFTGTFYGHSKLDVMSFLLSEGYEVYKIETSKYISFLYGQNSFILTKMSNKDLIFWLTQLSTYVKSGIPLIDAIRILGIQMGKKGSKQKLFENINYELTLGSSFSDALQKQKGIFPNLLINMIKAAEATGELEETLDDMANYYTEIETTRKQMISAMTYPSIITVFALGVITFILLYVIPQFETIYDSMNLQIKGITKFVINMSRYLGANINMILLLIVGFGLGIILLYKKVKTIRYGLQYIGMKLPVIGKIIIYNELTIFTKTFASLLKNNVFITESINILSKITNNEIYRNIMFETINNIARGDKISESFKNHWAIPEVAYYMIVTGESTGELASMMYKVSQYYQEEHKTMVNSLKSFIEPITIALLAAIVGLIIMSVIVPMFQLYSELSI